MAPFSRLRQIPFFLGTHEKRNSHAIPFLAKRTLPVRLAALPMGIDVVALEQEILRQSAATPNAGYDLYVQRKSIRRTA